MTGQPAVYANTFAHAGMRHAAFMTCPCALGGGAALNLFQTVHLIGAASSAFAARQRRGVSIPSVRRSVSKKVNVYAVLQGRVPGIYAVSVRLPPNMHGFP